MCEPAAAHPEPSDLNCAVLALSFAVEGYSLLVATR